MKKIQKHIYSNAMELINTSNFEYHIFDIKPAVDALIIPTEETTYKTELARNKH